MTSEVGLCRLTQIYTELWIDKLKTSPIENYQANFGWP